jgi:homoserine kinase type II
MVINFVSELNAILENYDLGRLVGLELNERGYVNTSFAIETVKDGVRSKYFLRKYKNGIRPGELAFEHALIAHLSAAGVPPVARLHRTRKGETFVHYMAEEGDQTGAYYAIFDFLPGEDRYTWVSPLCTQAEVRNAAIVLAQFHQTVSRFSPQGKRAEGRILDLLPVIVRNLDACLRKNRNTVFDAYLSDHQDLIRTRTADTLEHLSHPQFSRMVQIVVHCDFHPGNLKFHGDEICGLFDFDWSKVDFRCFDVALALWYFFVTWEEPQDGVMRLEEVESFLTSYQDALRGDRSIGPLNKVELRALPNMIQAANLYVLNWTILDHFQKEVDPGEYLVYLQHGVQFIRWFNYSENRARLERLVQSLNERED